MWCCSAFFRLEFKPSSFNKAIECVAAIKRIVQEKNSKNFAAANLLANFSILITYENFITLGLVAAVPASAGDDHNDYDHHNDDDHHNDEENNSDGDLTGGLSLQS